MEYQKYQLTFPLFLVCYNAEADLLRVSVPVLLRLERKPGIEHKLQHGNSNEYKRDAFSLLEGKGKAVQLQAWSGPEGSRKLTLIVLMWRIG